jgi:hypothetical protein
MKEIKVGDIVYLKSEDGKEPFVFSHVFMTVLKIRDFVECAWFRKNGKLRVFDFPLAALKRAPNQ